MVAGACGSLTWAILTWLFRTAVVNIWDVVCGILVLLCAMWATYWIANLGGGFRINMLLLLSSQDTPISLDQWMDLYGGAGMHAFLRDRLKSILLRWNIVHHEDGTITLTRKNGHFFGWAMHLCYLLFDGDRRE